MKMNNCSNCVNLPECPSCGACMVKSRTGTINTCNIGNRFDYRTLKPQGICRDGKPKETQVSVHVA